MRAYRRFSTEERAMPIRIKPIETLKAKFKQNTGSASQSYKDGINNPRRDQKAATLAAAQNYVDGINEAIADNRFEKGVNATPAGKWQANSTAVGAGRYITGAPNATEAWGQGVGPVLAAIAGVPDMPRGVKGSEQNFQRQRAYAMAAASAKKNK
jgi:hypothetical protein